MAAPATSATFSTLVFAETEFTTSDRRYSSGHEKRDGKALCREAHIIMTRRGIYRRRRESTGKKIKLASL